MIHNPTRLALLLALSIAIISAVAVWLFSGAGEVKILILTFFISGTVAFAAIYLAFEKILFRHIEQLRMTLREHGLKRIDDDEADENSIRSLAQDILSILADKQQEIDRLKNREAFRKDFIADVSHELKTPIFAAQGFVHTLLDGAVKEKAVRKKFLKKAAKSLDGLDNLVQDLLTLSQIETGQVRMRFGEVDLYGLADDVIEQFRSKVDKKNISLRIDGRARKIFVYADAQRIGQVLTNLISNAIKHSGDGGEVIVSFSVKKKSVITRVKDFGEGIPAEHIHHIFERFYRVDKSRSREKGGTGLGLAIVKHILDGHQTRAEVESEPGKGSTFSFRLPRFNKEEDNAVTESHERTAD